MRSTELTRQVARLADALERIAHVMDGERVAAGRAPVVASVARLTRLRHMIAAGAPPDALARTLIGRQITTIEAAGLLDAVAPDAPGPYRLAVRALVLDHTVRVRLERAAAERATTTGVRAGAPYDRRRRLARRTGRRRDGLAQRARTRGAMS